MEITYSLWKKSLKQIFTFDLWWRLFVPTVIQMIILISLSSLALGMIENKINLETIEQLTFNSIPFFTIAGALTLFLIMLEIGLITITALHITTKKFFAQKDLPKEKQNNNPFYNFFQETTPHFIPFHLYLFRVMWFVGQPILFLLVAAGISIGLNVPPFILILLAIIVGGITFYRSLQIVFSIPFYFEFSSSPSMTKKEIFEHSLAFSSGKLLSIFLSSLGIGIVTIILSVLISIPFFLLGLGNIAKDISGIITSLLFSGGRIVFFYILYKILLLEENKEKKEEIL